MIIFQSQIFEKLKHKYRIKHSAIHIFTSQIFISS